MIALGVYPCKQC